MKLGWRRASDPLSCKEVGRVLQAYLDGEVDEFRARQVARHLDACQRCGLDAETYLEIKRALRRRRPPACPHALDRLVAFGQQLGNHPFPPSGEEPAGV